MKFVSYRRVSTGSQAIDGQSLGAQDERIAAWAAAGGHTCLGRFEDAGISGATITARAGIQSAVKLACRHKAALVVCSLSRLARSTRDALARVPQVRIGPPTKNQRLTPFLSCTKFVSACQNTTGK